MNTKKIFEVPGTIMERMPVFRSWRFHATLNVSIVLLAMLGCVLTCHREADAYETFTNPTAFDAAIASLAPPTIIDFDELDASPLNNTFVGRDAFPGDLYQEQGISFSNPNDYPLTIAPGGLSWNASNSLSIGRFPFDPYTPWIFHNDDDLDITLSNPVAAFGVEMVENSVQAGDKIQFFASDAALIAEVAMPSNYIAYRAFFGIVSPEQPVAMVNIIETADDSDDATYDTFTFIPCLSEPISLQLHAPETIETGQRMLIELRGASATQVT